MALAEPAPSTQRMAALLEQIAARANPAGNLFLSAGRVEMLRTILATNASVRLILPLRTQLAAELLNAGQPETAREELRLLGASEPQAGRPLSREQQIATGKLEGLTFLRVGEVQNCLSNHNAESCLLPLAGGGIHRFPANARLAAQKFAEVLALKPDDLEARWLLNIAAMSAGDYPDKVPPPWLIPLAAFASDQEFPRFREIGGVVGLDAETLSGGSAAEDFDGDGFLDLMVTSIGLRDPMHFYHNQGDGTFLDRTREAGLGGLTGGLNLVTADFDNDGDVDVLVLRGAWMREEGRHPNSLLRNNGDGTFTDVTEQAGILSFHHTQTAVWFDFDGDGWLDLFIGNEHVRGGSSNPCELFHNNHDGTFTDIATASGLRVMDYVKGVVSADFNNDGRPDLYVSIHGAPNRLFRNDGPLSPGASVTNGWKFTEIARAAGVTQPDFSFPCLTLDFNNDGWEDILVPGYKVQSVGDVAADYLGLPGKGTRTKLYRNRGDGTFADVSQEMGVDRVLHAMGANVGDIDNDGWPDFYLGTGDPDFAMLIPNRLFRNDAGRRFNDVTTSAGVGHLQKGHGVSFADFDNDGDQDIFEELGGAVQADTYPSVLFENPGNGNHWIKLQLVGTRANRAGIGARLRLTLPAEGGSRSVHHTVSTGGSFGANPIRQELGLGSATQVLALDILWPGSGTHQTITNLPADHFYRLHEDGGAEPVPLKRFTFPSGLDQHSGHPARKST